MRAIGYIYDLCRLHARPLVAYMDIFNGFCNAENTSLREIIWENRNMKTVEMSIEFILKLSFFNSIEKEI